MLFIRVELWPNGDPRKARILGTGTIVNDLTGDEKKGNYDVMLNDNKGAYFSGKIVGFNRQHRGVWDILKKALSSAKRTHCLEQILEGLEKGDEKS